MYQDLKQRFWWTKMKIEIAKYVARCDTCRRVKAVRLKPAGMLQPLPICNTPGVYYPLSSGFELKHDRLSGKDDVKVNLWR
jgi:hypothetical protein